MCCFSRPIISVSATNIFAHAGEDDRQFLIYTMDINSKDDVAMILPLPVKKGAGEKTVEFIDLKGYPDIFADLRAGFRPDIHTRSLAAGKSAKLEVILVGDFEASFVPTIKDFGRLDERFRLPPGTWDKLPDYKTYGFAIFKLKPGAVRIHPMAFSFPRHDVKTLFFPTVHIHDGKVHAEAEFDHALYCQPRENEALELPGWEESESHATTFVKVEHTKGVVLADRHCYKKELHGYWPNRDTFIGIRA